MPNWKKLIVSGSDASLSNISVDNAITASNLNVTSTGSIDNLTVNDKLQLGGAGSQFFAYNEDTVKVKFANWYSSNDRQYGMGQLWYETWFAAIDNQGARDNRRIGFYLEEPDSGSSDADGGSGGHPSNARFYVDIDGAYLSGSLNVENAITASYFKGDGSALTNISAEVTEQATVSDSFTNVTSHSVTHNFGTKNVIVSVYNNSDQLILPASITTTDTNTVDITFDVSTTGRVVVAKGGHLVSGSAVLTGTGVISGSSQLSGFVSQSGNFTTNNVIIANGSNSVTSSNVLSLDTTNNYLGINQTNPEVTLHMTGEGPQTAQIRMEQYNDTADAPDIRTRKARGTADSPSAPNAGDYLFRQNVERYDGSGFSTMHSQQFDLDSSDATKGVYQLQTNIGSGLVTRFQILSSGDTAINGHLLPSSHETYDLGSTTKRWRDLYLSGSTINLGGTLITRDGTGDIQFKDDSTDELKTLRVKELEIGTGANKTKIRLDDDNKVSFEKSSDSSKVTTSNFFKTSVNAASEYTITHGLGEDYPIVQVYDTDKNQVIPKNITSNSSNQVKIEFDNNFTGTVVIKK